MNPSSPPLFGLDPYDTLSFRISKGMTFNSFAPGPSASFPSSPSMQSDPQPLLSLPFTVFLLFSRYSQFQKQVTDFKFRDSECFHMLLISHLHFKIVYRDVEGKQVTGVSFPTFSF